MFDFKITKGPWAYHLIRPYGQYGIAGGTEDSTVFVANVLCAETPGHEQIANAQAIAGIPCLLDAASQLLDACIACQDGNKSVDDLTDTMGELKAALQNCGGILPANTAPTLFGYVDDWKRVDRDGVVSLKVFGFPIRDGRREGKSVTSESIWVEVLDGDDCTGVARITTSPISSRFIVGQLITYGGGSINDRPQFTGVADGTEPEVSDA